MNQEESVIEITNVQLEMVNHAKNCIQLYNTIYPENNSQILTIKIYYGSLFGFIERLLIESIINSVCKLIHKPKDNKKSDSNHYSIYNLTKLEQVGLNDELVLKIDEFYEDISNIENNFDYKSVAHIVSSGYKIESRKLTKSLYNRLFDYRDKFMNHTDKNRMSDKYEAKIFHISELFPLVDNISELITKIRNKYVTEPYQNNLYCPLIDTETFFNDIISNRIRDIIDRKL